jgi:U3 small nucleolar RNA-associated protein 25
LEDYVIDDEAMLEDDDEIVDLDALENDSDLEDDDEEDEEEDDDEEDVKDDELIEGDNDEIDEEGINEGEDDDDVTLTQADSRIFNWFFNEANDDLLGKETSVAEVTAESGKLKLLESNLCLTNDSSDVEEDAGAVGSMYGSLNVPADLLPLSSSTTVATKSKRKSVRGKKEVAADDSSFLLGQKMKVIGDLPCLHKMFKHQLKSPIPGGKISQNMLGYLTTYSDLLIEGRDHTNDKAMLAGVMQHITNHIVYSRSKVLRNNQKIKQHVMSRKEDKGDRKGKGKKQTPVARDLDASTLPDDAIPVPDQGYTRARILILCPFRNSAYEIVKSLQEILGTSRTTTSNLEKFLIEFGPQPEHQETSIADQKKPADWKSVFNNNVDDDFKIGLQINPGQGKGNGPERGSNIRLYSDFFQSDIIIASPLGMRLIMEKASDSESGNVRITSDFLSSLEMVYAHQTDVMFMQNWSHLEFVLKHSNQLPLTDHDADFTRIRPYFLEQGESAKHRQLILTSNFNDPQIQAVYRQYACSKAGQLRLRKLWHHGCIEKVSSKVKQIFYMVPTTSKDSEDDERHAYFLESILSHIIRLKQKRTLIVTPSYLNYVRVRNELIKRDVNAAFICEYSRESEISRGRSQFFHGVKDVMLYSGRAHFFRRFQLRGACNLVFYSLPEYAHFYHEIVNTLGEGESLGTITSCLVLSTKYEKMALERLVGVKQCAHMLQSHTKLGKTTFMFC